MQFSIIYSADIGMDQHVREVKPPRPKGAVPINWHLTEQSDGPDTESADCFGGSARHRKWCALLTKPQFAEFIEHCGLVAQRIETMGSIGAPGFGIFATPAISFDGSRCNAYQNAYVTPVPCKPDSSAIRKGIYGKNDWDRIKAAVVKRWGNECS